VDAPAKRYHHGDLKAALTDAAVELIAERGVRGFSLAELSRRVGVTVAAPYRHFADRDELLAAVATRAVSAFADALRAAAGPSGPAEPRLAAMAGAYVRFAAQQRPLFAVLFGVELDKMKYPDLRRAWEAADDLIESCVMQLCDGDAAGAEALENAVEATARGYAAMLAEGDFGDGPQAVQQATEGASAAARALIAGRALLP
jgi:AcrR family transcriptional regulator